MLMIIYLTYAWFISDSRELYCVIVVSSFILIVKIGALRFYLVILFFVIIITSPLIVEVEVKNLDQKLRTTENLAFHH